MAQALGQIQQESFSKWWGEGGQNLRVFQDVVEKHAGKSFAKVVLMTLASPMAQKRVFIYNPVALSTDAF